VIFIANPNSPIPDMPVLEVWNAKKLIVNKRTMGTGNADIDNPLFHKQNTSMSLDGAKEVCKKIRNQIDKHYQQ
jgi:NAD/NADP transhydrogenase beta subunit